MNCESQTLKAIKDAAIKMALHCGKIQLDSFRSNNIGINTKSNVYDVVTKVDKACEDYLLTEISRLYPTHSIIGEETGQHLHANSEWAWIVDPLDGTNSYSQGLPVFCVSIGVTYKGEGVVGVVYAPYLDELYTANIREVSKIVPQVRGFRRMGSAAYDLCCTSMGTIDAYWEYNLNPWDVCAGQLIVREAGGIVIPLCDSRKISIIAGPEKLVKILQEELAV